MTCNVFSGCFPTVISLIKQYLMRKKNRRLPRRRLKHMLNNYNYCTSIVIDLVFQDSTGIRVYFVIILNTAYIEFDLINHLSIVIIKLDF